MTATRAYLIATLAGPLVILATIALPELLIRNQVASSLAGRTIAVVAAESLLPAVRTEFAPLGVILEEATEESGLADRVRLGELDGYVVFPAGLLEAEDPRYVTGAALDTLRRQVSAATGAWWLSIVLTGYLFVGNWLTYLCGKPMHAGLRDNVPDFRLCVRSNTLHPFISFLYWRMNWHAEHHMFAGVPCYNLRKLAAVIAGDMPAPRTLLGSWREMLAIEKRRAQDPEYQFDTPLPPTAHPAVVRQDQVRLPADDRVKLEASIGELAPRGQ